MLVRKLDVRRHHFLGVPLDYVSWNDAVDLATRAMGDRFRLQMGDVNVSKVIDAQSDPHFRKWLEDSDVVCADGVGVIWGCHLLGIPVADRVTGIDLMTRVIAVCEQRGFRPYFLGATETVIKDLVNQLQRRHPNLKIAGWRNGYFRPEDEPAIVAEIKASGADCLFVGISSPIKERFLNQYRDEFNIPLQMGVGGSFDVLSGHVKRAPRLMQRIGLEWLFRVAQEPRRLARRYYVSNSRFVLLLLRSILPRVRERLGF
jgi:N-acetylglucosaminyldiphosphoundecaprenol N-acetyl-beta-D-mannosaminyltransferase